MILLMSKSMLFAFLLQKNIMKDNLNMRNVSGWQSFGHHIRLYGFFKKKKIVFPVTDQIHTKQSPIYAFYIVMCLHLCVCYIRETGKKKEKKGFIDRLWAAR